MSGRCAGGGAKDLRTSPERRARSRLALIAVAVVAMPAGIFYCRARDEARRARLTAAPVAAIRRGDPAAALFCADSGGSAEIVRLLQAAGAERAPADADPE